jgi:hypothetical protein
MQQTEKFAVTDQFVVKIKLLYRSLKLLNKTLQLTIYSEKRFPISIWELLSYICMLGYTEFIWFKF